MARNDGVEFELAAEEALRLAGMTVLRETLLGHKKVDLLATEHRFGRVFRTAVECKDYSTRLRKDLLVSLVADYRPLLEKREVDQVLVLTRTGLSAAGERYVEDLAGFAHQRLDGLLASTIDFSSYLTTLEDEFNHSADLISSYYQSPHNLDGDDIGQLLLSWARDDSASTQFKQALEPCQPVAVLASYGMGKSSLARWLAADLAAKARADSLARIPVLINLGEISDEQSLEGLLGKHMTATHAVAGYSYGKFMALNRLGRFVIICDGFDEMKQRQSWSEFQYNLRELAKLTGHHSRVIILGRPTAFETEEQRVAALHGGQDGGLVIGDHPRLGLPNFQEIELKGFGSTEIRHFLTSYLRGCEEPLDDRLDERISQSLKGKEFRDLASRPVQLRMLADLLPTNPEILDGIGVSDLYSLFINHLIEETISREMAKKARLAFSAEERRRFTSSLAYWLWRGETSGRLGAAENIPDELITSALALEEMSPDHLARARRDFVLASPVDASRESRLHFPHRSIQEYLVAEEWWNRAKADTPDISEADAVVSPEVGFFLNAMAGPSEDAVAIRVLVQARGTMRSTLYRALAGRPSMEKRVGAMLTSSFTDSNSVGPWPVLSFGLAHVYGSRPEVSYEPDWLGISHQGFDGDPWWPALCLFSAALASEELSDELVLGLLDRSIRSGPVTEVNVPATAAERRNQIGTFVAGRHQFVGWIRSVDEEGPGSRRGQHEKSKADWKRRGRAAPVTTAPIRPVSIGAAQLGLRIQSSRKARQGGEVPGVQAGRMRVRLIDSTVVELAEQVTRSIGPSGVDLKSFRHFLPGFLAEYAAVREWTPDGGGHLPVIPSMQRLIPRSDSATELGHLADGVAGIDQVMRKLRSRLLAETGKRAQG